jgi:hypothetical protein
MSVAADIERPALTMPEAEAGVLRAAYEAAGCILEYGSGGSTVLAAGMAGKRVTSVESDPAWLRMMKRWFAANPPADGTTVDLMRANIGPTRSWGHPADPGQWPKFAAYPLAVWQRDGFIHPDVVLVDGRFRIGCALATAFGITRPVTLLFDDYGDRDRFAQVEEFLGTPRMVGRMALFDVVPMPVPADRLIKIIRFMQRP